MRIPVIGFRVHLNPLLSHLNPYLDLLHLRRPYFKIKSHPEVLGGYEFWGTLFNPLYQLKKFQHLNSNLPNKEKI